MDTIYFRSSEELRAWFAEHGDAQELWVGFYKKGAGETGITYPEAVDEALCAGWIDGVRYGVDERRYRNRFTPRRPGSNWSQVNIRRVEELRAQGRMLPAGEAVFAARKEKKERAVLLREPPAGSGRALRASVPRAPRGMGVLCRAVAFIPAQRKLVGTQR